MTDTTHAIFVPKFGGPEVLEWTKIDLDKPGPGFVRVKHTAIGVNLMDIGLRQGAYPAPKFPFVPGVEAAGVVEDIGPGVTGFKIGDRVAYASAPYGSYAEARLFPAERLVALPTEIADVAAAGLLVKAITADFLVTRTYAVKPGSTIVIHAAAGGTGLMVCQLAKHLGATVIGTVSTDEKAELVRRNGCDYPVVYTRDDFAARVAEITGGRGVDAVYDSVGKDTFERSIECLKPTGTLALFGIASGHPPSIDLMKQPIMTSYLYNRPSFYVYTADPADFRFFAERAFDFYRRGIVKLNISDRFPLRDAAAAHAAVESRRTTGSLVLVP